MITYEKITGLHLELTTKCNAACPMCARNFRGKTRENLKIVDLSLSDCKIILSKEFLQQIEFISICGVFGDPINNSELLDILGYIYTINNGIYINIYTNGGIRDEGWWKRVAKILVNGNVIFGIDGIDEVSSIHRRNTDINVVFRNVKAFIGAGGSAKWDFIAFKHNERQIEQACELSRKMGFKSFQVKKTSRFFKNLYEQDDMLDSTVLPYGKHPIYDINGQVVSYLEMPTNCEYRNATEEQLFEIIKDCKTLENYYDSVEIECHAIKTNGIFVSALGDVYPCCTIYQQVCYGAVFEVADKNELNECRIWQTGDTSAFNSSIKDIVNGETFKKLQEGWAKINIEDGKPKACCRTCGKNLNMHLAQHEK